MTLIEALILGLIQGFTEFFPISSSAHVKIAKLILGLETSESHVIFDLSCHFGSLIALLYFFNRDIVQIFRYDHKKAWLFFIAMLPLIPFYFLLKPVRDAASKSEFLGFFMIATALILFGASWVKLKKEKSGSPIKDALWIGTMQAVALIPGISRSAATIGTARSLGWTAQEAVRFSFLLSIPTILGGTSFELVKIASSANPLPISLETCIIGFVAALGAGLLIVTPAIRFLEKGNLNPFAWYCLIAGILVTVYLNV
jgi:undecaprenyl-diphosphatase